MRKALSLLIALLLIGASNPQVRTQTSPAVVSGEEVKGGAGSG